MSMRPCLDCGLPSHESRCPEHTREEAREQQARRDARRDRSHVHTNNARWKNLSKRLRRLSPFCALCSAIDQLQVDHIVRVVDRPEWAYEEANLRVLCRRCNSSLSLVPASPEVEAAIADEIRRRKERRCAAEPRGGTPRRRSAPPALQPVTQLHTPWGYTK